MDGIQRRRARREKGSTAFRMKNSEEKVRGTYNAENCVSCASILNGLINNGVFSGHLVSGGFPEVGHSGI